MSVTLQHDNMTESVADDSLYEVVDGRRVELHPMGAFEVVLANVLAESLSGFVHGKRLGIVVVEMLFVLNASAHLRRRPDVAFVSYERWPDDSVPRAEAWDAIPDLAIEIISPSNRAEEVDGKVVEYFQAGVRLVWVFYPESGRIHVFRSANDVHIIERDGNLDGGDVLPGLQLSVQSLYDRLTRPD